MSVKRVQRLPGMWAILPEELNRIKTQIESLKPEDFEALLTEQKSLARVAPTYFVENGIGVLSVEGIIQPKLDIWSWLFGGTSIEIMTRDFKAMLADDSIEAIVLDIDSPGGVVHSVQEFANLIYESRDIKPIYSVTSSIMASAAYWIGSAAEEILVTDESAITGSIGVVVTHVDVSEMQKKFGIKVTEITAGKKKRIASMFEPLSDAGRAELQSQVDHIYGAFVADVAKFRGVDTDTVLESMADGAIFLGSQGIEAGLVDGILPSDEILSSVKESLDEDDDNFSIFERREPMAITKSKKSEETKEAVTAAMVKAEYPQVYDAIFNAGVDASAETINRDSFTKGKAEGVAEGKATGIIEGAKAEMERIKAVEEQTLRGHEALVEKMKFDGKTTGEQAAVAILAAERMRNSKGLKTLAQEAPAPVEEEEEIEDERKEDEKATPEAKWKASKELQAEFGNNFESYKAYEENVKAGNIRVFNPGRRK